MKKALQYFPFFLLLLPLFIILRIENTYHHLIHYRFVVKEIVLLFLFPLLVYFLSFILLRSVVKSNLLSGIVLFFLYFSGEIKNYLTEKFPGSFFSSYSFLLPLAAAIIITAYVFIKRKQLNNKITLFLNLLLILLIMIEGAGIIFSSQPQSLMTKKLDSLCDTCKKPDIYYIIFDSYSSSGLLDQEFGYDNTGIENFLKEKGFHIVPGSRSNYNLTPFSISSIFNMQYLTGTDTIHKLHSGDYLPAVDKVYYSDLFPLMKAQGYAVYNHSIFDFKDYPSTVLPFDIWDIKNDYQQYNLVKKVHNEIGWNFPKWLNIHFGDTKDYISNRNEHDSAVLQHLYHTIADTSAKPKFIYAHFFIPHSPYSFDSLGNKISLPADLSPEEDKKAYVQQLVYANTIMKKITTAIQERSGGKAVMIIQGDHGYRFFDAGKKQSEFRNLNAVYFPGNDYRWLNDSTTSVNTFRIVFNTLFHQNYSMLPGQTYFLKYK